ncbi:hypothetical protein [Gordonia sp. (in: high G+C Gram-positive bacteria)]|uniref:hypothetical protein n=1 Tax=Gordonia sp. (in: high G+C Gram-positive bacteria) TaxID=84139 RepID=UPI003C783A87
MPVLDSISPTTFIILMAVLLCLAFSDMFERLPRSCGSHTGDRWPTHRDKARRQKAHRAARRRRRIRARRAAERGHLIPAGGVR